MRFLLQCLVLMLMSQISFSQVNPDSVAPKADSVILNKIRAHKDSLNKKNTDSIVKTKSVDSFFDNRQDTVIIQKMTESDPRLIFIKVLKHNSWFNFLGKSIQYPIRIHQVQSNDFVFYYLVLLFFYFALIKLLFRKYLLNLFTLFFRASMRQQQIREQVLQAPLPSLLLNILFILNGSLYAVFLIRYYHFAENINFWILLIYCAAILMLIYLCKFVLLKLSGWVFNISGATDTYIFIIFLACKILAVFLLPFLVFFSFSGPLFKEVVVTISIVMIVIFFAYRFIATFPAIRNEIKVSGFHFFLYLCAFEIAPLLLIYKVLLTYLEKAY